MNTLAILQTIVIDLLAILVVLSIFIRFKRSITRYVNRKRVFPVQSLTIIKATHIDILESLLVEAIHKQKQKLPDLNNDPASRYKRAKILTELLENGEVLPHEYSLLLKKAELKKATFTYLLNTLHQKRRFNQAESHVINSLFLRPDIAIKMFDITEDTSTLGEKYHIISIPNVAQVAIYDWKLKKKRVESVG